jgi:hypothetical protein
MKLPVNLQPTPRKPNKIEHGKEPKMSEQWEEIKIEDVQPGDVARCNGREFPVERVDHSMKGFAYLFKICGEELSITLLKDIGFTFHRKVKREPRTGVGVVKEHASPDPGDLNWIDIPKHIPRGTRLRWTELLDGEDGA